MQRNKITELLIALAVIAVVAVYVGFAPPQRDKPDEIRAEADAGLHVVAAEAVSADRIGAHEDLPRCERGKDLWQNIAFICAIGFFVSLGFNLAFVTIVWQTITGGRNVPNSRPI